MRLLAVGLPLTIVAGAVLAVALFPDFVAAEAVVLAVLLAPTDAALGQAVVTEPGLPSRIRQGLNVESGLNDGICVPLLLIALAAAEVEDKAASGHHAVTIVAEEIGYGIVGGAAAGLIAAAVVAVGRRRNLISAPWLQVIPVAGAGLAYGVAVALGGSGFIAAFLAGGVFGALVAEESEQASRLNEEIGALLGGVTFLLFGAVLLGPALEHISWQIALYAVLALTLARMLPVAIALLGSDASWQTVGFLGWFGPRGLASIVFAVITVQEAHLAGSEDDPAHDLPDDRTVGRCPRDHRCPARAAVRAVVRIAPAQPPAGDGERGRCTSSIALAARAARLRFGARTTRRPPTRDQPAGGLPGVGPACWSGCCPVAGCSVGCCPAGASRWAPGSFSASAPRLALSDIEPSPLAMSISSLASSCSALVPPRLLTKLLAL